VFFFEINVLVLGWSINIVLYDLLFIWEFNMAASYRANTNVYVQLGLNQILDLELIFSPYGAILKLFQATVVILDYRLTNKNNLFR
jgi:hypothetical protein